MTSMTDGLRRAVKRLEARIEADRDPELAALLLEQDKRLLHRVEGYLKTAEADDAKRNR